MQLQARKDSINIDQAYEITHVQQADRAAHPASQAKCWRSTLQLLSEARCSCEHRRPVL